MSAAPKEVKLLLRAIEEQGFTVRTTTKGHLQVRAPSGQVIAITGGTPSDHRAIKNFRADLRRGGVSGI